MLIFDISFSASSESCLSATKKSKAELIASSLEFALIIYCFMVPDETVTIYSFT